jgi:hypothetical protein
VFIAALFIIAKKWKITRCPSNWWIAKENTVHIYSGILLDHKKDKILSLQQHG